MTDAAERINGSHAPAAPAAVQPGAQTGPENRKYFRHKVIWSGRISAAIGDRPCTVLNISRGGAYIKLDPTLDRCANVELMIPSIGRLTGWVAWSNQDRAGIAFSDLTEATAASLDQALRGRRGAPVGFNPLNLPGN